MISTTKTYSPVSYRRPDVAATTNATNATTANTKKPEDNNNMTNKVQLRSAMFEELSEAASAANQIKKIPIKKGWMADMQQAQGNKYGRRVVGFSTLPPKRTLADLP